MMKSPGCHRYQPPSPPQHPPIPEHQGKGKPQLNPFFLNPASCVSVRLKESVVLVGLVPALWGPDCVFKQCQCGPGNWQRWNSSLVVWWHFQLSNREPRATLYPTLTAPWTFGPLRDQFMYQRQFYYANVQTKSQRRMRHKLIVTSRELLHIIN